MKETFVAC